MLYGLSLSFCIKDILEGKVNLVEVECIVAGTLCVSDDDWNKLSDVYCAIYWRKNPEVAKAIVGCLMALDKIYQPRVDGFEGHNISRGHWAEVKDEI